MARVVVFDPSRIPTRLRADGAITRTPEGFRLVLKSERDGDRGLRTLVAENCGDLLRAATLVLALAYGEGVALRTDEEEPPPAPAVRASPTLHDEAPVAPPVSAPRDMRLAVGLELGVSVGMLPTAAFEGGVVAELGKRWWGIRGRVSASPGTTVHVGEAARAKFATLSAGLEGCGAVPGARLRGEGCAGVVVSGVHGRATGTMDDREALAPVLGLRAALGLGIRLKAFEPRLVVGGQWNTTRPRFDVSGFGAVHTVGEVVVTSALGFVWSP